MRSHAKASTAGSTQRQAGRLGRILRGALATRGSSSRAKGSGAPKARRLVLPLAVLALVLALAVPPASALKFHDFKEIFGSAAQPTVNAWALGIDQSSGDVLVMDATGEDFTVKRFNPDGTPDNFSALGTNVIDGEGGVDTTPQGELRFGFSDESQIVVDNSGTATDGNIYVTQSSPNLINIFASTGAYLGQLTAAGPTSFSEACGVAVDSTGALYVGDYTGGIHKFVPAANPPVNADNTATFTTTTNPCALAAGAGPTAGFLFPVEYNGPISKIDSATGELKYMVASGSPTTVAVNPSSGHVYDLGDGTIEELDASGAGSASVVSNTPLSGAPQGLAVRGSSGDIFYSLSISNSDKVNVLSGAVSTKPDVTTDATTNVTATGATLNGTVNPDGEGLTECVFEWGPTTGYGNTAPCVPNPAGIGSGTSPVAVSAAISGLDVATVHHYRLKAGNANGPVFGSDQSLQTSGPVIVDTWAEDVTITEATLKAEINPEGAATTYHFEYGTTPAYGQQTPELNAGSDSSAHELTRFLSGLQPGTEYHYRVVATNAAATNEGSDRTIRTFVPFRAETDCPNQANRHGAGANLPDCRAYELVSPLDKNNGDITTGNDARSTSGVSEARLTQSTPAGDKLTYSSSTAFGDALSAPWSSQYIAQRSAGGWQTHSINLPAGKAIVAGTATVTTQYEGFSEDLCQGWVRNFFEPPLAAGGLAGVANIYRRRDRLCGAERFEAVAPILTPPAGIEVMAFQGASADGSHAVFLSFSKLAPEGTDGLPQAYESVDPETAPRFVCILPSGEPWTGGCTVGAGSGGFFREDSTAGAISDDGERIFWSSNASGRDSELYVRIGGTETLAVSQAGEEEAGTTGSWFWGAAADGSRAIYITGGEERGEGHLLAFDVDDEATEPIAEGVYGVIGMSEDARRIYFVSSKAIPGSGQNSEGDEAIAGQPNAYFYDADQGGGTSTFIGTLSSNDVPDVERGPAGRRLNAHTARVTPDGLHAAFSSQAPLTGYDNKDLTSGFSEFYAEAFVYDAGSGELHCASCNPSGARDHQTVPGGHSNRDNPSVLPFETSLHGARVLSEDGSRFFFQATATLTPRDSNGRLDTYQWEELGTGDCDAGDSTYAPRNGGCVSLISSGTSSFDSRFAEATPDGSDAFFYTTSSLVPQDYGLRDIYDARVGGGSPLPPEVPECVGDACQSIPPPPNDPTPASAGFRGAGDPAPRKAKRRCRARNRQQAKGARAKRSKVTHSRAKQKKAKRCRRNNRRAGR